MEAGPVFVLGTPRSGTTLLARILGAHSRLFMPGELHFFDDIEGSRRGQFTDSREKEAVLARLRTLFGRYSELDDQARVDELWARGLEQRLRSVDSYRDLLTTFMQEQAKTLDKTRWGNNVPRDIFNTDAILNAYPAARLIACIRDPRAFLLSYGTKWKNSLDPDRVRKPYHLVLTSLLWKSTARRILRLQQTLPAVSLQVVRYEDLVGNPETVVRSVCNFIGEDYEDAMIRTDFHNSSSTVTAGGIFSDSIVRWRQELDTADAAVPQIIAAREMSAFEYPFERGEASRLRIIGKFVSAPAAAVRALNANRRTRGALLPYLARRFRFG